MAQNMSKDDPSWESKAEVVDRRASDAYERVVHNLTNHPPVGSTGEVLDKATAVCISVGYWIVNNVPEGREQAVALTKLEEMSMWIKAGIARNQQVTSPGDYS